jgi:acyl-homoserine lactone acylase PvdQ
MRSNASTNTIYADNKGNIGYWHGNFIPVRDSSIDPAYPIERKHFQKPNGKTFFSVNNLIHVINPPQGLFKIAIPVPYSVSGLNAIKKKYLPYMAPEG